MLFLLLSGRMPFDTSDALILRSMHKDPVLNGDNLFRDGWWQEVPAAARSLVRGLLTVDTDARLSAAEAERHLWLQDDWRDDMDQQPQQMSASLSGEVSRGQCHDGVCLGGLPKKELRRSPRSIDVLGLVAQGGETKSASRGKEGGGRRK